MHLAEEFALLAYRDDGSPSLDSARLGVALAGTFLLELTLAGRITLHDKRIAVRETPPADDPLSDRTISRIAGDKPRKPRDWVRALAPDAHSLVLGRLVDQGVLDREQDRVLGVFRRTRYPAPHGLEPTARTAIRRRVRAAVTGTGPADDRTAALCTLLAATGLDRAMFADAGLTRREVKARLRTISQSTWAPTAVKSVVDEIQAAVLAVVIAVYSGEG